MPHTVKKHDYLLPIPRLFTRGVDDAYDNIPFEQSVSYGDETFPALTAPAQWSAEAVAIMAEAACKAVPCDLRVIEENTVPSWLWRHQSRGNRREAESDLRDIFNRSVGSASAKAWKLQLFSGEKHARAFYDETRYALMQRHIAIVPDVVASWGVTWAYGVEDTRKPLAPRKSATQNYLSNTAIDAILAKGKNANKANLWKKIFADSKDTTPVNLRLSDIAADWHSEQSTPAQACIDVMALRHNDGSVNVDALRHVTRLLCVLLDLQERHDVTIGIVNMAPLLMAFGLAYDSDAARAMTASICALVTAECVATSAEMACLRGVSDIFATERDTTLRALRNHRRAVYGDGNDYEKLSVLPAPLPLKNCPDLALVAEAQRSWDNALERARVFGLRATQFTDLTPSPIMAILTSAATQGLQPMPRLIALTPSEEGIYRAELHPAVGESLTRLDYPSTTAKIVAQHIGGAGTLNKSPTLSHAALRKAGLDHTVIEKIEDYLPSVNNVRLAITPWIIGLDTCRDSLSITAKKLESPRFDLLQHLGFSSADIDAANVFVYGHGTARNSKALHLRHRPVFACGNEVSTEARLRMAASVQSFVSGDTGITLPLPVTQNSEQAADITLAAWRRGLKSLTIVFDATIVVQAGRTSSARKIKAKGHVEATPIRKRKQPVQAKKPVFQGGLQRGRSRLLRA